jgi:hypothetical protein
MKTRVSRGSRDIVMASPWLESRVFPFCSFANFWSKRWVLFDQVDSWHFLGLFHERSNQLALGTLMRCALPVGFLCRLDLFHFLHPWIFCRHRMSLFVLWVPRVRFLAEVLLLGDHPCWILWVALINVGILLSLEVNLLWGWLVELCFSLLCSTWALVVSLLWCAH